MTHKWQWKTKTHLQVRLSSQFILKLAVRPLQDVDGGLADVNSQSWGDDAKHQPSLPATGVIVLKCVCVSYAGLWTPFVRRYWLYLQKGSSEASCSRQLLPHKVLHTNTSNQTWRIFHCHQVNWYRSVQALKGFYFLKNDSEHRFVHHLYIFIRCMSKLTHVFSILCSNHVN